MGVNRPGFPVICPHKIMLFFRQFPFTDIISIISKIRREPFINMCTVFPVYRTKAISQYKDQRNEIMKGRIHIRMGNRGSEGGL